MPLTQFTECKCSHPLALHADGIGTFESTHCTMCRCSRYRRHDKAGPIETKVVLIGIALACIGFFAILGHVVLSIVR